MHAAPSVTYPVGRSAFAGALLAVIWLEGLLACLLWIAASGFGWRQAAGLLLVAGIGAHVAAFWWRSPQGLLRWTGAGWEWEQGGRVLAGQAQNALDLQARMLLRWRDAEGGARWIWVERKSDASHWDALRRAVYSRANPTAGTPDAAEQ